MEPHGSVLGVENSLCGQHWRWRKGSENGDAYAQALGISPLLGQLLAARCRDPQQAESFLSPKLRALTPDPFSLTDMGNAAETLAQAIISRQAIAILSDYDVDGMTSACLLARFLNFAGQPPCIITIPERSQDGYGPNARLIREIAAAGAQILVVLDCGTTALSALADAHTLGLRTLVIDHHQPQDRLPTVAALVNPKRQDDQSGLEHLAAVSLTFLFILATARILRTAHHIAPPPLRDWLDIVALGTVADVVPLIGVNRAFVQHGLRNINAGSHPGLSCLATTLGRAGELNAQDLAFSLAPALNAAGRLGSVAPALKLLQAQNTEDARGWADELAHLNRQRRDIQQQQLDQALDILNRQSQRPPIIMVGRENWHPGVLGIIAARITQEFHRPALVFTRREDGTCSGSARAPDPYDIGSLLHDAHAQGLLISGGGHARAGGFSFYAEKEEKLQNAFAEIIGEKQWKPPPPLLEIDALLEGMQAQEGFLQELERLHPYGADNPLPCFALSDVCVQKPRVFAGQHLDCTLVSLTTGKQLRGIAFHAAESALGKGLRQAQGQSLHVAGHLQRRQGHKYNGAELIIKDAGRG